MSADISGAHSLEAMIRAGAKILSGAQTPRLDARVLAKMLLQCDDAGLIARGADPIDDSVKLEFSDLIFRRAAGEPVAYITGEKEFWGLSFAVTRDTLIPRADSECIVEAGCNGLDRAAPHRILDLGTGSGCLLCAALSELPAAQGVGVDQSAAAVEVAQRNAETLGFEGRADIFVSDWFQAVEGAFDLILANAPYIPSGDRGSLIVDVSDYEPSSALFSGEDGLDDYRRIFSDLPDYLAPSSRLVIEYGDARQGEYLRALAAKTLRDGALTVIRDLAGRERGLLVQQSL